MDSNQVMVKQTYRWVVGFGILLVLIGVGVFVQVKSAHDTRLLHQDLLVGEAVNQLEGCATCHDVTNRPSLVLPKTTGCSCVRDKTGCTATILNT